MNILDKIVRFNTLLAKIVFVIALLSLPLQNVRIFHESSPKVAGAHATYIYPSATPIPPSPTPTDIPIAKPTHIDIPSLNISTNIVEVGLTNNHTMDIPTDFQTTGWYINSPKPGEDGAAIINGHFDTNSGSPAIFYNMGKLAIGDKIEITTEDQKKLTFIVEESLSKPLEAFPADIIYGSFEGKGLKLITCDGIWNPMTKLYSERRIIIARLLDETNVELPR